MNPLSIIGLGAGLIGGIGKLFSRGAANRRLRALQKEDPIYKENPLAAKRLGLANTLLNARMPSAASVERNIYQNQANTVSNAQRSATSGNDLLLAGGAIQGQTNQAFNELGEDEATDYQRRYGNQVAAQEGLINEQDKVFQDQTRRFGNKVQIQGAISGNQQAGWGDISNMGFGIASFGLNGGFGGGRKLGADGKPL